MSTISSISSATSSPSSSSLGRGGSSSLATDQVIENLRKKIWDFGHDPYFRSSVGDAYRTLLRRERNVNVQHKGLSILHYCSYTSSYAPYPEYLELMQDLLRQGADPDIRDAHGRTPLFFQSTEGDDRFMKCLVEAGAKIDSDNPTVKPLHVVVCLLWKKALPLLKAGAHAYALDKFDRTPLHCAVLYSAVCPSGQFEMNNVRDLIEYAPLSTEYADKFQNYPLYYAFLYGSPELIQFLSSRTTVGVVQQVLRKIQQEIQQGQFASHDVLEDGIYQIDSEFFPAVAGGRDKSRNAQANKKMMKEEQEKLEQRIKEETYEKDGIRYSLLPDNHGKKHLEGANAFKKRDLAKQKAKREFLEMTKVKPATFYPQIAAEYNTYLANVIRRWVDKGADFSHQFLQFGSPIGAAEGRETCCVQLYYCGVTYSHMRPICKEHIDREKAGQKKELENLEQFRAYPALGAIVLSYCVDPVASRGVPLLKTSNHGKKVPVTKNIQNSKQKK